MAGFYQSTAGEAERIRSGPAAKRTGAARLNPNTSAVAGSLMFGTLIGVSPLAKTGLWNLVRALPTV